MSNTTDMTGGKPIAVLLQFISSVSAINPLGAFYDIHGGKRQVLFFYFVPDTTRDYCTLGYFYINDSTPTLSTDAIKRDMFMHTKFLYYAGIETATSCVVGEYSDHYTKSAVKIR
jgi:hypothetical protein